MITVVGPSALLDDLKGPEIVIILWPGRPLDCWLATTPDPHAQPACSYRADQVRPRRAANIGP